MLNICIIDENNVSRQGMAFNIARILQGGELTIDIFSDYNELINKSKTSYQLGFYDYTSGDRDNFKGDDFFSLFPLYGGRRILMYKDVDKWDEKYGDTRIEKPIEFESLEKVLKAQSTLKKKRLYL